MNSLTEINLPDPELLNSDLLVSRRGKIAQLITKRDSNDVIKINKKEKYEVQFTEPIFLDHIQVNGAKPGDKSDLIISGKDISGNDFGVNGDLESNESTATNFIVKRFVTQISVKNENKIFSEEVKEIKVYVHNIQQFEEICNLYSNFWSEYDKLKEQISKQAEATRSEASQLNEQKQQFKTHQETLAASIKQSEADLATKTQTLKELQEELEKHTKEIDLAKDKLEDTRKKETGAENNVQTLKQSALDLNNQISKLNTELKDLSRRKDLYAENMENYIGESKNQLRFYYILSVISVAGILAIAWNSVSGLNGLIQELVAANKASSNIGAWDFFIMRAPYATICITIIGALITFIVKLVDKIFEIQHQRREIISLSVLARDINHSAADGLDDLDQKTLYKLREEAKFKLLSQSIVGNAFSKSVDQPKSDAQTEQNET